MAPEQGEEGGYVESYTLDAVLGVFERIPAPVFTSADVADELGCSLDTAWRKLEDLHEEGRVERYKTANRTLYWPVDGDAADEDTEQTPRNLPGSVSQMLVELSRDLDESIAVGGHTIYEDGERRPLTDEGGE
jgi:predicted transcriptional regulator